MYIHVLVQTMHTCHHKKWQQYGLSVKEQQNTEVTTRVCTNWSAHTYTCTHTVYKHAHYHRKITHATIKFLGQGIIILRCEIIATYRLASYPFVCFIPITLDKM